MKYIITVCLVLLGILLGTEFCKNTALTAQNNLLTICSVMEDSSKSPEKSFLQYLTAHGLEANRVSVTYEYPDGRATDHFITAHVKYHDPALDHFVYKTRVVTATSQILLKNPNLEKLPGF